MSSSNQNLVADVQVGDSRKHLSEKQTARVTFNDFASLPHEVGQKTRSPIFSCHGRDWQVNLYPGGEFEEDAGNVSLYLCLRGKDRNVKAKYSLRIPSANESVSHVKDYKGSHRNSGVGWGDFCWRDDVLNSLDKDGALVMYVDIQIYTNAAPKWKPKKKLHFDMTKLLKSGQFTDVTFSVKKRVFPAHRCILFARAPALAALAEEVSPEGVIELENIDASIFELSLRSMYSDEAPVDIKGHAIDYLELADLYGCVHLKLLAESELETSLSVNNAADLLLLADAKNCALLKESALFFIVKYHSEVLNTPGWTKLSESLPLLKEIMATMARLGRANSCADDGDESSDFSKMSVRKLRDLLEEHGLEVDGSKEMLVKRLQEPNSARGSDMDFLFYCEPSKRRRTE